MLMIRPVLACTSAQKTLNVFCLCQTVLVVQRNSNDETVRVTCHTDSNILWTYRQDSLHIQYFAVAYAHITYDTCTYVSVSVEPNHKRKQPSGLVSDHGAIVLSKASKKVYSPMLSLAVRFRPMTHHSKKNGMAPFQTSWYDMSAAIDFWPVTGLRTFPKCSDE